MGIFFDNDVLAKGLGYVVGFGSLMLYTPIAVRLIRQKHADGLVMSTWWLKVTSYLLSDAYYLRKRYDLSTYSETVVITIEAMIVLGLVAFFQQRYREPSFWVLVGTLLGGFVYGLTLAPEALVATGQLSSALINVLALLPQFWHNFTTKTKGDYSPWTAGLAVGGCAIRLFTTIQLNGGDPILMVTFLLALAVNGGLLGQIFYYGMSYERLTFRQVLMADVVTARSRSRDPDSADGVMIDLSPSTATSPPTSGEYGGLVEDPESTDIQRRRSFTPP